MKKILTSEFVSFGHPDIIADTISDSILDLCLDNNRDSRVAVETLVSGSKVIVAGEISGVEISDEAIHNAVKKVATYSNSDGMKNFTPHNLEIQSFIRQQSKDISIGVDTGGAGDQGVMFGFSCNWNVDRIPTPLYLARNVCNYLVSSASEGRRTNATYFDCKTQFSVEYDDEKQTFGDIKKVVCSIHHSDKINIEDLRTILKNDIISFVNNELCYEGHIEDADFYINPTGSFTIGGCDSDTGLTGRKLIVGTYGGFAHIGGGALSGKDPSKVDRSAALFLRHICNTIVAKKYAGFIELQASYAIGVSEPMSVAIINCDEIGRRNETAIIDYVKSLDFSPKAMIESLGLKDIHYVPAAMYGHFGVNPTNIVYPWETMRETIK